MSNIFNSYSLENDLSGLDLGAGDAAELVDNIEEQNQLETGLAEIDVAEESLAFMFMANSMENYYNDSILYHCSMLQGKATGSTESAKGFYNNFKITSKEDEEASGDDKKEGSGVVEEKKAGFFKKAWEAIKGFFKKIGEFFRGIWNKIKGFFANMFIKGQIQGVISKFKKCVEAVKKSNKKDLLAKKIGEITAEDFKGVEVGAMPTEAFIKLIKTKKLSVLEGLTPHKDLLKEVVKLFNDKNRKIESGMKSYMNGEKKLSEELKDVTDKANEFTTKFKSPESKKKMDDLEKKWDETTLAQCFDLVIKYLSMAGDLLKVVDYSALMISVSNIDKIVNFEVSTSLEGEKLTIAQDNIKMVKDYGVKLKDVASELTKIVTGLATSISGLASGSEKPAE